MAMDLFGNVLSTGPAESAEDRKRRLARERQRRQRRRDSFWYECAEVPGYDGMETEGRRS